MTAYAYRLVGNAKSASPDYIPSLIGIDEHQTNPAATDAYFERTDLASLDINMLAKTRWVSYDSRVDGARDPLVGVKVNGASLYLPLSELQELSLEVTDDGVRDLIDGFLKLATR